MMKKNLTPLCLGILLLVSHPAESQDGLFISEVTDPADDYSGRFIELYNAGSEAVDFSTITLYLSRQSNGGTGWGDLQLSGTVEAGETFVIGGSAFPGVFGFAPDQESGIHIGNGDDAWFLYRDGDHLTGFLHDIYGAIDTDGTGEPWEYEDSRAVRIQGISHPNPVWTSSEWNIASASLADCDPGTHHASGGAVNNISLVIMNDTVRAGEQVEVPVSVSALTVADNIISYQFDIDFDPVSLEYAGNELTGTLAEGGTVAVNTSVEGKLSVSYMNAAPLVGAGEILRLRFSSLVPDTTAISISSAYLNMHAVQDLSNSTVIILSLVPPAAAITYNDTMLRFADTLMITATFSQAMDEAHAVQISFSGATTLMPADMERQSARVYSYTYQVPKSDGKVSVRLSNGRDLWGNEVLPLPTKGESFRIMPFNPGDVDDDGSVMAYDAALALQHSVGLDPIPLIDPLPWEAWRDSTANVDGSGIISAYDAGMILQYSAGIITSFSGGQLKMASMADVSVRREEDQIMFYSHGNLVGLNIFTTNEHGALGEPVILGENLASPLPGGYLSAFNKAESTYRIGLCTATAPAEGLAVIRIPVQAGGAIGFHLLVNGYEKFLTLDLGTGMSEAERAVLSVYPNPARDRLFIQTGNFVQKEGYRVKITDLNGRTLFETRITEALVELDLSTWSGSGLCCVQVTGPEGSVLATRKVVLR